ncbi:galactose mutarotase [Psychromarinibacter sp. C21-152]|uniref:Galactose mutarotase n=1 Tax=Psychromarinibacter sediminicola TaxID=3033385 RepID=A0AAE3NW43_9RHOB|nr:aldose epimerase family protein [Psychromarinibacter sediminicola]MDF0603106.1 galactose mutarotase [Psychromarinibacter sediminicola]
MADTVFGTTAAGETVHRLMLGSGELSVALLTHGAVMQDVRLAGVPHSLTVGSPEMAAYEDKMASCGALMGPVVNRITDATVEIDGQTYELEKNFLGKHTIHGGAAAFHHRVWEIVDQGPDHAELRLTLADGEGGLPGNRAFTALFEIRPPSTIRMTLRTETDAPTPVNLANHSYWRLDDAPTVKGHVLQVAADRYTPRNDDTELLPTGEIADVTGTRFDFRQGRELVDGAEGLIDNNLCLGDRRVPLRPVAWLTGQSGLRMEMATTEPGLQVFDGHILGLPFMGNDGAEYVPYAAVALEAQFWPDAPTHPNFPDITLRPGEDWEQITEWRFLKE